MTDNPLCLRVLCCVVLSCVVSCVVWCVCFASRGRDLSCSMRHLGFGYPRTKREAFMRLPSKKNCRKQAANRQKQAATRHAGGEAGRRDSWRRRELSKRARCVTTVRTLRKCARARPQALPKQTDSSADSCLQTPKPGMVMLMAVGTTAVEPAATFM